ncbi:PREDICTED: GATA transcription factor 4-like [Nelumbo nucifera]|uniref:GATA transcription factor n=1 Tax=Nelumbo nucifera TaxID=4432 RepID=A0A1U8AA28_NELNU|nr:PREDICTED: GATA transcription factor 4-like [Nelumbo nucifera]
MDMFGLPAPDFLHIDDLLDFSNDDLFSDSDLIHLPPSENNPGNRPSITTDNSNLSTSFPNDLCVPNDDVAELEWLSKFVDDSYTDFPTNEPVGNTKYRADASVPGRTRSKRSRAASTHISWTSLPESYIPVTGKSKLGNSNTNINSTSSRKKEGSLASSVITAAEPSGSASSSSSGVRKCTHCASEKTPQWRTGPLGPKTLCNACGVRYKSGRLVPEYRPAASPTFVLAQHSNSHRKVMELRRQKEILRQQSSNHHPLYHHHPDFKVC